MLMTLCSTLKCPRQQEEFNQIIPFFFSNQDGAVKKTFGVNCTVRYFAEDSIHDIHATGGCQGKLFIELYTVAVLPSIPIYSCKWKMSLTLDESYFPANEFHRPINSFFSAPDGWRCRIHVHPQARHFFSALSVLPTQYMQSTRDVSPLHLCCVQEELEIIRQFVPPMYMICFNSYQKGVYAVLDNAHTLANSLLIHYD